MMQLCIAGNLGRDAELRQAGNGMVCNFSVAVSGFDHKTKQKTTHWVRCAIWGKRAEQLAPLLTKGSKVAVSGEMTLSEYQGKTSIELKAQDVTLLGGGQPAQRDVPRSGAADGGPIVDDPLPF